MSTKLQCLCTFSISQLDCFCPGREFPFILGDKVTLLWQPLQMKIPCDIKIRTRLCAAHCSGQMFLVSTHTLLSCLVHVGVQWCLWLCGSGATSTPSATGSALPSLELLIVASTEPAGPCGCVGWGLESGTKIFLLLALTQP